MAMIGRQWEGRGDSWKVDNAVGKPAVLSEKQQHCQRNGDVVRDVGRQTATLPGYGDVVMVMTQRRHHCDVRITTIS